MSPVLAVVSVLIFSTSVGLILPSFLRLVKGCNIDELSADWLESFSSRSYQAMDKLLTDEDFEFLSRQPGFDLRLYRKFRRDRLRIYKQYLNRMIADFNRLHLLARLLVAQSQTDQSALASRLVRIKLRFSAVVLLAEFRYVLCWCGVRALSARALITELESLTSLVSSVSPAAA